MTQIKGYLSHSFSVCILLVMISQTGFAKVYFKNMTLDTQSFIEAPVLMSFSAGAQSSSISQPQITRHYILEYKTKIQISDQDQLKELGVEILNYIPENAYIVRINDLNALRSLNSSPAVKAVVPYLPKLKVNYKNISASIFQRNVSLKLHVQVFAGADTDLIEESLVKAGVTKILSRESSAFVVEVPQSAIQTLSLIDGIEWIDLYTDFTTHMIDLVPLENVSIEDRPISELTGLESGTEVARFPAAWKRGFTGKGQIVGVSDTGLDTGNKKDLSTEFVGLQKAIIGGSFSNTWGDPDGHGTHVSGTLVAQGAKSDNKVRGGAFGAKIVFEAMWSEVFQRLDIGADPTNIFAHAYAEGVRIHSNSWGNPMQLGSYDFSARAADAFMWEKQDILLVFSAGNFGADFNQDGRVDAGSISSPGTAKNVLTVGASENLVDSGGIQEKMGQIGNPTNGYRWPIAPISEDTLSDNINGIAAFSSRGPTKDQRIKPDIVAPGTNLISQCSQYENAGSMWGRFNKDLCYGGGTSMSTPLVAAGAVLVREYLAKVHKKMAPSAALVKAVLIHTTDDLYPGQYGEVGKEKGQELLTPGPNNNQGYGRINMERATSPRSRMKVIDSSRGLRPGQVHRYRLPAGTRKVTLSYTDAPGAVSANKTLVNDLDIKVTNSKGEVFVSSSKESNLEQLVLPAGSTELVLEVMAKNIPMVHEKFGGQPYAFVMSK